MSAPRGPRRGAPHAGAPARPRSEGSEPWAGFEEGDDWSVSGEHGPDAGHGQTTGHITDPLARPAHPGALDADAPRLVVLSGPTVGQAFVLVRDRITVGRGRENDVVLADPSVSRVHARLERRGPSWQVTDLDSGNGTFMHGERVGEVLLALGDQVAFGQVRLQLQGEGGAGAVAGPAPREAAGAIARPIAGGQPSAAAAAPPGRPSAAATPAAAAPRRGFRPRVRLPRLRVVAVGVGLAALGTVWGTLYTRHVGAQKRAFARCQAGMAAFGAGHWDEAEQAFADARAIVPGHALTLLYAEALSQARRDAATLLDVAQRREQGDLSAARAALRALGDTPLIEARLREQAALATATTQLAQQAETALQAGLGIEAGSLLATLGEPLPARPDVQALAAWSAQRQQHAELEALARAASRRPRPVPSLWDQAITQPASMRAAIAAFRRGTADRGPALALALARRAHAPAQAELIQALRHFASLWETAAVEHRGKRAFAAIKLLTDARATAVRVAGEACTPVRDVDAKLADMYYVLGVQALMGGELAEAAEALRTAVARRPGHALSVRKLDELEERAERMVDEAEFQRSSHSSHARALLRQVVQAMPSGSPVAVRARRLLEAMGQGP